MVKFLRDYRSNKVLGNPNHYKAGVKASFSKEAEAYLVENKIAEKVAQSKPKNTDK